MADGVPITAGSGTGVAADEVALNLTGTVAKNGTTTLTGTGTAFLSEISVGQVIRVPGVASEDRTVASIASNTSLTVTTAFAQTASGQTAQRVAFYQKVKLDGGGSGATTPVTSVALSTGGALQIAGGTLTSTSGSITAATSTVTSGDLSAAGAVTIAIFGTYAGVNATFEGSPDGGTTWFPLAATREDSGISESTTGVLTANTSRVWLTGMPGLNRLRVRATAWTSGTATVILVGGALPIEPMVSAVQMPAPLTPTRANVAASATSVTLRAANVNRKGLMISNQGTANLYVDLTGGTATTTTANSFLLGPNQSWAMDFSTFTTGLITGIWSATGGNGANVTEFV